MSFRGQPFAFGSPSAAIEGMQAALQSDWRRRAAEPVPLAHACGRFLAADVMLDRDSPPFDASVMDGFAVRCSDLCAGTAAGMLLDVHAESRIGQPPPAMPLTGACRISTGAALPTGADAVVPRELVVEHLDADGVRRIEVASVVASQVKFGDHIRRQGEHARAGTPALAAGTLVGAATIGSMASIGASRPAVEARLRVVVITTGEELVPHDGEPRRFQIRDSNGPAVEAALTSRAWIDVKGSLRVASAVDELQRVLRDAADAADAIVLTGGVSMGHRDPVRAAIESLDASIVFHGLPQRPGKPMLGAVACRGDGSSVPIFGLPGNPLSALVTCERIVVPVLAWCAGGHAPAPPHVPVNGGDGRTLPMWWHRLACLGPDGSAVLLDARSSGDAVMGGRSHGFIEVPPGAHDPAARFAFHAWPC